VCTGGLLAVTVALIGYQFLGADTPLWYLGVIFFIQGAGMANVMPPATESVMSALPREKAGAGSAINNTARQVAVALGVAILGSVVSSIYRDGMRERLTVLPEDLRHTAGESIAQTLGIAQRTGHPELVHPAYNAFIDGMHVAAVASAVIALLGSLVVLKWMPGKVVRPAADTLKPEAVEV
jgi:hypothetical protein